MEIRFCKSTASDRYGYGYVEYELTAQTPEDGYSLATMYNKDKRYMKLISKSPPRLKICFPKDSESYTHFLK